MGFDRLLRAYALAYCWLGTPKRYAFRYRPRRFRLKICHRHIFFTPKPSRVRIRRTEIYRKDRFSSIKLSYGGESGIRTHGTLPYDGFQDRSVITTSVSLRIPKKAKRRLRLSFSECYYNKLCRPCQCKILIFSRHGRGLFCVYFVSVCGFACKNDFVCRRSNQRIVNRRDNFPENVRYGERKRHGGQQRNAAFLQPCAGIQHGENRGGNDFDKQIGFTFAVDFLF